MKYLRIVIAVLFLLILLSCSSSGKAITMEQTETKYPVVLRLNKKYKRVKHIKFPIKIKIYNPLFSRQWYSSIHYDYEPFNKGLGESIYVEDHKTLKEIHRTKHKNILPFQTKEYILYTSHHIDHKDSIHGQFQSYVQQMLNKKQDTIAIGTIQDFKEKYGDFLQKLTYKDSIHISTLNKDRDKFGEIVIIPVKF